MVKRPVLILPVLAALAGGLAFSAIPAAAQAAPRPAPPAHSARAASPQAVIVCKAKVNYPHSSTHVPGSVNATGSVTCTAPVTTISFTMYLNESGFEVAQRPFINDGKSSLGGNVAVACAVGTTHDYQAFLSGTVKFPPGYTPPIEGIGSQSPNLPVKCA